MEMIPRSAPCKEAIMDEDLGLKKVGGTSPGLTYSSALVVS